MRRNNPPKEKYVPKTEIFIRQEARKLRRRLNLDHIHAPDLDLYVILRFKAVFPDLKLKKVLDADLPNSDARAYCKAGILKIRKSVVHLISHYGDGRARWTFAHELGHLVLKHPMSRLDRKRPEEPIPASEQIYEDEAHIFASEFLAPTHLALKCKTSEEIRVLFQISPRAAVRRMQELDAIRNTAVATAV